MRVRIAEPCITAIRTEVRPTPSAQGHDQTIGIEPGCLGSSQHAKASLLTTRDKAADSVVQQFTIGIQEMRFRTTQAVNGAPRGPM